MILESIFSCSCLLLTCGSCIYTLAKHSYIQYRKLHPHFMYACGGFAMISVRSLLVLVYKLFLKQYPFDPVSIELEEETNRKRFNVLDELLGTLSIASIIYSVYCHHGYCLLGSCVVIGLSVLDMLELRKLSTRRLQAIENVQLRDIPPRLKTFNPRYTFFIWLYVNGYFVYSVGNNYALMANYPYLLTTWGLTPEGFYQGWTIRRTINDYMMAAYTICMTEALRQVPIS